MIEWTVVSEFREDGIIVRSDIYRECKKVIVEPGVTLPGKVKERLASDRYILEHIPETGRLESVIHI